MSKLKAWFDVNGWINYKNSEREGMGFYGSYDDYIINIIQKKGYKEVKVSLPDESKDHGENIVRHLNSLRSELKISKVDFCDNIVAITLKETFSPVKVEVIEKLLKSLTDCLYKAGIKDKNYCSKCTDFGASDYAEHKGVITPFCNSCYQEVQQAWQQGMEEDQGLKAKETAVAKESKVQASYLRGVIGALVGGLLGSIALFYADRVRYVLFDYLINGRGNFSYQQQLPRWYLIFETVYNYGIYLLIALGVFMGYRLLRGKMDKAAPLIMMTISSVFLMITPVFVMALNAVGYGRSPSISFKRLFLYFRDYFVQMVLRGHFIMMFWRYMAISMAMCASMILICFGIYKYRSKRALGHNKGISA